MYRNLAGWLSRKVRHRSLANSKVPYALAGNMCRFAFFIMLAG